MSYSCADAVSDIMQALGDFDTATGNAESLFDCDDYCDALSYADQLANAVKLAIAKLGDAQ